MKEISNKYCKNDTVRFIKKFVFHSSSGKFEQILDVGNIIDSYENEYGVICSILSKSEKNLYNVNEKNIIEKI